MAAVTPTVTAAATMSSIGALTAQFTPPASCYAPTNIWQVWAGNGDGWYEMLGPPDGKDCMPPGFQVATTVYYSPALCPVGFTAAKKDIETGGEADRTTHVCCPTEYSFSVQPTQLTTGLSDFVKTILCETVWPAENTTDSITVMMTTSGIGDLSAVTTVIPQPTDGWLRANGIVAVHQSGDFDSKTTPTDTPSTSAGNQGNGGGGGGGLSSGASIGIGVGVGVFGLTAAVGLVWFLLRARRKKQEKARLEANSHQEYSKWKPSAPTDPPISTAAPAELETVKYAHELPPEAQPQELEARH